jgi:hypothetical protein
MLNPRGVIASTAEGQVGERRASVYWPYVLPGNWVGPYPEHWCGAFALWVLNTALETGWLWKVGRGFLFRLQPAQLPLCGDIAYRNKPLQHHAVITSVYNEWVTTVDGNSGFPAMIRKSGHKLGWHGWAYFSVARMIEASRGR